MCQHFRFHVALHETRPQHSQKRNRERDIELHVKCGRRQNHCADRWRIIVHPCRHCHRREAMGEHDHVLDRNSVSFRNMPRERVYVLDHVEKTVRRAAVAGRSSVAARIPGENRNVIQVHRVDHFLPATGMLMTTMKKKQRFVGRVTGEPAAIKQLGPVPTDECLFNCFHFFGVVRLPRHAIRQQSRRSPSCPCCAPGNSAAHPQTTEVFAAAAIACLWATLEKNRR